MRKTKKREEELVKRYKEVYPNIIFPPNNDMFDIVIDTTKTLPDEIIEIISKKISTSN
jgi:cytidylate kinase